MCPVSLTVGPIWRKLKRKDFYYRAAFSKDWKSPQAWLKMNWTCTWTFIYIKNEENPEMLIFSTLSPKLKTALIHSGSFINPHFVRLPGDSPWLFPPFLFLYLTIASSGSVWIMWWATSGQEICAVIEIIIWIKWNWKALSVNWFWLTSKLMQNLWAGVTNRSF